MKIDIWESMYPSNWKGVSIDEAFVHPAKFSSKLIKYIYEHMIIEGWIKPGDTVIDPFGGGAFGALDAMRNGLKWRGVELEEKFVILGQGMDCPGITKKFWRQFNGRGGKWLDLRVCPACGDLLDNPGNPIEFMGTYLRTVPEKKPHRWHGNIETWQALLQNGDARLYQGDSRYLARILCENGKGCVSSPPYKTETDGQGLNVNKPSTFRGVLKDGTLSMGESAGNLGSMKASDESFQASISSPPFLQSEGGTPEPKEGGTIDNALYARHSAGNSAAKGYGESHGNLGNLKASDEGFQASVSSPPFEEHTAHDNRPNKLTPEYIEKYGHKKLYGDYGESPGQLSNDTGDDFWLAARQIVEQVFIVLEPGAHAVWIVKDFVKNKERVNFCDQWRQMCEAVGFVTLHEHHASLINHRGTQLTLEGGELEIKTESKSFFRRLAEKKGSPRIDWETVFCMEKPNS